MIRQNLQNNVQTLSQLLLKTYRVRKDVRRLDLPVGAEYQMWTQRTKVNGEILGRCKYSPVLVSYHSPVVNHEGRKCIFICPCHTCKKNMHNIPLRKSFCVTLNLRGVIVRRMSMTYQQFIGPEYPNEKGTLVTIFSQSFPLNAGTNKEYAKSMFKDKNGIESDIDAEYLTRMFKLVNSPRNIEVRLKNQKTKDYIKSYILSLDGTGEQKDVDKYDTFFFIFLTYLSSENTASTVYRDERIHLYDGLCPMQEIYDEVKKVKGLAMKPKIFLIQADDIKLLHPPQYIKGQEITKPFKIPQDADRLVIMSDIPQRFANRDKEADVKNVSFMIKAFGDTLLENSLRKPEGKLDLFALTVDINCKVKARIEELLKQEVNRAKDMNVPLVTSTLTKLVNM